MIKIFIIVVSIFILVCVILALIIKGQNSKNKELKNQIEDYKATYFELNEKFEKLLEVNEIEKRNNEKLAKKLADISCMSIDAVLAELQK